MKFTFKTDKDKWNADLINIKYKKKAIGYFRDNDLNRIHIRIIKDDINSNGNPNCIWKYITFLTNDKLTTIDETKNWLNTNIEKIFQKFNIYLGD